MAAALLLLGRIEETRLTIYVARVGKSAGTEVRSSKKPASHYCSALERMKATLQVRVSLFNTCHSPFRSIHQSRIVSWMLLRLSSVQCRPAAMVRLDTRCSSVDRLSFR